MPGIGPRTGARILAEIGDGSAFANGSKLAAYACGPGHPPVRASKTFYDRKRAEGKRHNAALICLARRRCDVILAMLRTHQPYQPTRPSELASAA